MQYVLRNKLHNFVQQSLEQIIQTRILLPYNSNTSTAISSDSKTLNQSFSSKNKSQLIKQSKYEQQPEQFKQIIEVAEEEDSSIFEENKIQNIKFKSKSNDNSDYVSYYPQVCYNNNNQQVILKMKQEYSLLISEQYKQINDMFENNIQNSLLVEFFLKKQKSCFLVEQWGLIYNELSNSFSKNIQNLDMKLQILSRSIIAILFASPLHYYLQMCKMQNQEPSNFEEIKIDFKIHYLPTNITFRQEKIEPQLNYHFISDLGFLKTRVGQLPNIDKLFPNQNLYRNLQKQENHQQQTLKSLVKKNINSTDYNQNNKFDEKPDSANKNSKKMRRFQSEDMISQNTTNDTIESQKSSQKLQFSVQKQQKNLQRTSSNSSLENNNNISLLSLYSKKDDITILSNGQDDMFLKMLDDQGKDLELETILDTEYEEHEFQKEENEITIVKKATKIPQKLQQQQSKVDETEHFQIIDYQHESALTFCSNMINKIVAQLENKLVIDDQLEHKFEKCNISNLYKNNNNNQIDYLNSEEVNQNSNITAYDDYLQVLQYIESQN